MAFHAERRSLPAGDSPANTGNVGRLCHATGTALHLIEPLGFSLEDRDLRRAGLDYWSELAPTVWSSLDEFLGSRADGVGIHFLTAHAERPYWDVAFGPDDCLVFGPETRGLPAGLLQNEPDKCLTIPQVTGRSLNLSTAAGVVLYEAIRQLSIR